MDGLMNTTTLASGKGVTMTSREIADLTGKQHQHVKRDIEKTMVELGEDVSNFGRIYRDSMNREQTEYVLDRDHTETLLLSYSAELRLRVVRRMREMEAALAEPRIPTTAEAFATAFTMLADAQKMQAQQNVAIAAIGAEVEQIKQALTILPKVPLNGELITYLRARIHDEYGLSAEIVNQVIDCTPYGLSPKFAVRNTHENAEGSVNVGYYQREVNTVFRRFVDECVQVTPTMCTHPYIKGRFRLIKKTSDKE
ncbi:Rha family transcriptional regulator [Agrobacterium sp. FDAARGOS_525]|uniref:Rha family transcriptional regulator n=1 Tax=Agrobacterium sp. FDAARGOS_525 TaxID=2420311 RepID=UPI001AECEC1A|nr:Rha family transcriptional regulator [Agrobacterium sp. FDAARGOS_525]